MMIRSVLSYIVQIALVRLCYGDTSLEMVQAIADLADGYAKEDLWPQASNSVVVGLSTLHRERSQRRRHVLLAIVTRPAHFYL